MGVQNRNACLFADLGYGDSGKGTMVDWYARTYGAHTVIRFNGGPQARHNVVTPDGRHHTFSQFGSATFVDGCRTHLSKHMLVSPLAMVAEEKYLRKVGVTDAWARATISRDALVITPFQRAANRIRELSRGDGRHGSCGVGLGETVYDAKVAPDLAIHVRDLYLPTTALRAKLDSMREFKVTQRAEEIAKCRDRGVGKEDLDWYENPALLTSYLRELQNFFAVATVIDEAGEHEILERPGTVVFEPSQGVLLDEALGFDPYTTWSNCTFDNALTILRDHGYDGRVDKIGVVRAYMTRHGPGPFVTEDKGLTAALPDAHNAMDAWQGAFRVGWFDSVAIRYAIAACGGVDGLAVTCFDRLREIDSWDAVNEYALPPSQMHDWTDELFETAAHFVKNIRLGNRGNLPRQRLITTALEHAVIAAGAVTSASDFDAKVEQHIAAIEHQTGAKVRFTSFGTSASDKKVR